MCRCALDNVRTLPKDRSQVKSRLNNPALNKCEKASFATQFKSRKKCEEYAKVDIS